MAEEKAENNTPEEKPGEKTEAKSEAKPEVKSEAKSEAKSEVKSEAKSESVSEKAAPAAPAVRAVVRKKGGRSFSFAKVFVQCSFNNTHVSVTDDRGNVLCWSSAGAVGFKGTKKGTPFAAQMTATKAGKRAVELGVKQVAVFIKGPGPGRETAIRALQSSGLHIVTLKDVSPIPHNGCRPPKPRRV